MPKPPEVINDVTVRNVKDDEGRNATFRIMLFSDEFRWRINSFDARRDRRQAPAIHGRDEGGAQLRARNHLSSAPAPRKFRPARRSRQGRAQEERRAARRAEKIAVWVREALNRPIPVRKLNVGHHAPTGSDDTSDQRRVVIILVLDQDDDANIDQSLRSAMAGESVRAPIFEALLTKYSLGGGDSFTWVP